MTIKRAMLITDGGRVIIPIGCLPFRIVFASASYQFQELTKAWHGSEQTTQYVRV